MEFGYGTVEDLGKVDMILATGGLGFLGGRIASKLLQSGKTVRIATSKSNPSVPPELLGCELVTIDLLDEASLVLACKGITTIIHLAAANARASEDDCERALQVNGLGTLKLLNAAKICSVSKFIYFSTIHVYGGPLFGCIDETRAPKPQSSYAITHRLAEDYVLSFDQSSILDGVVLRLANVVGVPLANENNGWELAVNDFCRQALVKKKIKLNSSGLQKRNFIAVADVLEIVAILVDSSFKNLVGTIFNVGGETTTISEVANNIAKECNLLFGYTPAIEKGDLKELESNFEFDCGRVKTLGYSVSSVTNEIKEVLLNSNKVFVNGDV
jgi:UDP-glucose 4-epimerase